MIFRPVDAILGLLCLACRIRDYTDCICINWGIAGRISQILFTLLNALELNWCERILTRRIAIRIRAWAFRHRDKHSHRQSDRQTDRKTVFGNIRVAWGRNQVNNAKLDQCTAIWFFATNDRFRL